MRPVELLVQKADAILAGQSVLEDRTDALLLYQQASALGAPVNRRIGLLLWQQSCTAKQRLKAVEYLKQAARQGEADVFPELHAIYLLLGDQTGAAGVLHAMLLKEAAVGALGTLQAVNALFHSQGWSHLDTAWSRKHAASCQSSISDEDSAALLELAQRLPVTVSMQEAISLCSVAPLLSDPFYARTYLTLILTRTLPISEGDVAPETWHPLYSTAQSVGVPLPDQLFELHFLVLEQHLNALEQQHIPGVLTAQMSNTYKMIWTVCIYALETPTFALNISPRMHHLIASLYKITRRSSSIGWVIECERTYRMVRGRRDYALLVAAILHRGQHLPPLHRFHFLHSLGYEDVLLDLLMLLARTDRPALNAVLKKLPKHQLASAFPVLVELYRDRCVAWDLLLRSFQLYLKRLQAPRPLDVLLNEKLLHLQLPSALNGMLLMLYFLLFEHEGEVASFQDDLRAAILNIEEDAKGDLSVHTLDPIELTANLSAIRQRSAPGQQAHTDADLYRTGAIIRRPIRRNEVQVLITSLQEFQVPGTPFGDALTSLSQSVTARS